MYKDLSLTKLSLPIFIQMILSMSAGMIDTAMISSCGDDAVGSIGNANQVIMFLTLAYQIVASSSGIVVSQYLGAGKSKSAIMLRIYKVAITFNLLLSVVVCLLVTTLSSVFLNALHTPFVMFNDSVSYMKIVGCFLFCQSVGSVFVAIFNVHGKTYIGMLVFLMMDLLNITGNYLFLFGPLKYLSLMVRGVAISTSFSSVVATAVLFIIFKRIILNPLLKNKSLNKQKARTSESAVITEDQGATDKVNDENEPYFAILKKLLSLGIPAAGESFSYSIAQIFITGVVNTIGPIATTTRIYCNMLANFNMIYANSVAEGTAIITGQSVGAADYDYAYRRVIKSARFAILISVSIAIMNFLLSRWTFHFFTQSADIIALGRRILLIGIFLELGRATNLVVIRCIRASGDVLFPVIMGVVSMWAVAALGSYLLALKCNLGLLGVWVAMASDEILRAIIACIRWKCGAWRNRSVVGKINKT